ncbi:MAG: hypothetical protein M3425_11070 [Actinomycetota bacterium]|nr:hypothetical protein [Actinomycetota bacterium]
MAPEHRAREGALLRLEIAEAHWAEALPPVPQGCRVSVSFADAGDAAEHGDALGQLGYRVVAAQPAGAVQGTADILVDQQIIDRHPTYWRSLAVLATRAYSLAMGPVLKTLEAVLGAHASATVVRTRSVRAPEA